MTRNLPTDLTKWTKEDLAWFQQQQLAIATKKKSQVVASQVFDTITPQQIFERYSRDMRDNLELADQPRIAIDLDGTIAEFVLPAEDKYYNPLVIGEPRPGSQQLCENLMEIANLWIWTCRLDFTMWDTETHMLINEEEIVGAIMNWLIEHEFPKGIQLYRERMDRLNKRKPFFCCYIGDDAIPSQQYENMILEQAQNRVQKFVEGAIKQPALRSHILASTEQQLAETENCNEERNMGQSIPERKASVDTSRETKESLRESLSAGSVVCTSEYQDTVDTNETSAECKVAQSSVQSQLAGLSKFITKQSEGIHSEESPVKITSDQSEKGNSKEKETNEAKDTSTNPAP